MKNTHICPKCNSSDIATMPGGPMKSYSYISTGWRTVYIDRLICTSCGFTEEWISKFKDLDYIRKKFGDSHDYDKFV
jgi:ribosomal protein S27AE